MSLRIRRGTEAQRTGATFDLGEIVWTTDTGKLYVGDGVNAGGKNILATSAGTGLIWNATTQRLDFNGNGTGIINVQADATPSLGGNLNLNGRTINGTGNITINGTINATQFVGVPSPTSLSQNLNINSRTVTGNGTFNITGAGTFSTSLTSDSVTAISKLNADNVYCSDSNPTGFEVYAPVGLGLDLVAYRGTSASQTPTLAGDYVGTIAIKGLNSGSDYVPAAAWNAQWHATANLADNYPKATLNLIVGAGGDSVAQASFNYGGVFKAPVFQLTSYANDAARLAAIPTPSAGMMVFMTAGTSPSVTNKAVIYNGSAWALLPG